MPSGSGPELPSIWPPSWPATPPETTRRPASSPTYLQLAVRNGRGAQQATGRRRTIAQGGVLPNIQAVLLPKIDRADHKAARASNPRSQDVPFYPQHTTALLRAPSNIAPYNKGQPV
ncbi:unnamed protein product [Staurois parvus]|uniref:Histone H2A C-terminal domain-containing protein n=2 Tax=Staurois parvus TaxID=386267 RepID=A0ABN9HDX5_9NEOB|nr:unnamed protein product [Staurois parvus]